MDAVEELVAKFESEARIEEEEDAKENESESKVNESLDYLKQTWEIHDEPGSQEIKLTRKFNDETIEISFSVSDSVGLDEGMEGEDDAYADEEFDEPTSAQSGGANTKGAMAKGSTRDGNVRVAPEDSVAPADRPELSDEGYEEDEQQETSFPIQLTIKVTREGKPGAFEIGAEASDGYIGINEAHYWPSADLCNGTAEGEQKKAILYGGPSYRTLDADLQALLESYLEERGIDTELSLRLPEIVDWKEQQEYMKWLQDVKQFLS